MQKLLRTLISGSIFISVIFAGFQSNGIFAADEYPDATDLTFHRFCERGDKLAVCGFFSVATIDLSAEDPTIIRRYQSDGGNDTVIDLVGRRIGTIVVLYLESLPEDERKDLKGLSFQWDTLVNRKLVSQGMPPEFVGKRIEITLHRIDNAPLKPPKKEEKHGLSNPASRARGAVFLL